MDNFGGGLNDFTRQIKYIGYIGVNTSMRSLERNVRSEVAKESINRLCEATNISNLVDQRRFVNVSHMLEDKPNLRHSGIDVDLRIGCDDLKIVSSATGEVLFQHKMPNVSFASGGDEFAADFVAYVAKDDILGRACFVLRCYNSAGSILDAIACGFQSRSRQIRNQASPKVNPLNLNRLSNFNSSTLPSPDSFYNLDSTTVGDFDAPCDDEVIARTRFILEREPWFHGSYLSREASEERLTKDGDFLVRENMLEPGKFVLSIKFGGKKLHLVFDQLCRKTGKVKTKKMVFNDISHMIRYHNDEGYPIVAEGQTVYLRNGVRPTSRPWNATST